MKIISLMPARDENWIIGMTARAALRWCDALVVTEHACTDDTPAVLSGLAAGEKLARLVEPNPLWNEADYRQRQLETGRAMGGTHFALTDADELLTGNLLPSIRGIAETLKPGDCLKLPWLCCWRSFDQYRCDQGTFGRARVPMLFADAPGLTFKPQGDYQIHCRVPAGARVVELLKHNRLDGGVMHFQHAEWRRLLAKQALNKMIEAVRWNWRGAEQTDAMYSRTVDETGLKLADVPAEWWGPWADLRGYLRTGQVPWQEAEAKRLMTECGPTWFVGLNLYGVV